MENNLNIVTYNIQHGAKTDEIVSNIQALARQKVNLFCLQEVHKYKGQKFIVDELLSRLGPDWQAQYILSPEKSDLGLCTLWKTSKLTALNFEQLMLPKLNRLFFHEKIFETVMSKHARPIQRAALIGEFAIAERTIRITNLHLDWQGGFKQRSLQLNHLKSLLKSKQPVNFEIFCGDFNTIGFYRFDNGRLEKVKNLLGKEFLSGVHKKATTSHLQTLDHIFVKNLTIEKTQIFKYKGSDHFPLLAEIRI